MQDPTEFIIHMSSGLRIGTNNFDTAEGLRDAIEQTWEARGSFSDGLSIRIRCNPEVNDGKFRDANAIINPAHVMHITDMRED